jgi:hypothetical protein
MINRDAVIAAIEGLAMSGYGDGDDRYNDALETAVAAIRALPDAWRPIDEADGSLCQVTDGGYAMTAFKQDGRWVSGWNSGDITIYIHLTPTHFMPLTSPPEGE